MIRFFPYVLKTLWRHRTRSLLTIIGAGVALFVFCFIGSIHEGMRDLEARAAASQSLIAFQVNKFCPATSHLPQDYDRKLAKLDGVRQVVPIQVLTNNCRASLDVIVFYGLPAEMLRDVRDFRMTDGEWSAFTSRQDAAVVGRRVAQRRGIRVGDQFSIGDVSTRVVGIFASDNPSEENYVYTHLDFLQRRQSNEQVGTVTQFEILLDSDVDATAKCAEIDQLFRSAQVATDTRPKGVFQAKSLGDLTQLIDMALYLGIACVGLVLALVATTTFMSVQDRIKEHAVLQTIGCTGGTVFGMVLAESVLLSSIGGLVGIGAAITALMTSGLAVGAEAVAVAFQPSLRLAVEGLAVAVVTGAIAGIAPAFQAARVPIVPALRQA